MNLYHHCVGLAPESATVESRPRLAHQPRLKARGVLDNEFLQYVEAALV